MTLVDLPVGPRKRVPFWRSQRFWTLVAQMVFLSLVLAGLYNLGSNIYNALAAQNQTPNFTFLNNRAGFNIGGATNYSPDDSFWRAYWVGVENTLRVVLIGLVLATLLGVTVGIALLSRNTLVKTIARVFVEVIRNTPLLVQLFLWYFVGLTALPRIENAVEFPSPGPFGLPWRWVLYPVVGVVVALMAGRLPRRDARRAALWGAFLVAASVLELGFGLRRALITNGDPQALLWATQLSGLPNPLWPPLWVGLGVLALLLIAAWRFAPGAGARTVLTALAGGALAGALLFVLGLGLDLPAYTMMLRPAVSLSVTRGILLPEVVFGVRAWPWLLTVAVGITLALVFNSALARYTERTGRPTARGWLSVGLVLAVAGVAWAVLAARPATVTVEQDGAAVVLPVEEARAENLITDREAVVSGAAPLSVLLPERRGFRLLAGTQLSPEYAAVLFGLVVYTAAFIAEIVRAGIMAVPSGQLEAARALGLRPGETLRRIVLPQALRVIIPPLGNQYLNLAKNSSLAIVASYADVFQVMNTVINQSGQSVTGIVLIMVTYLVISLTIALIMNLVNRRFQLVTR